VNLGYAATFWTVFSMPDGVESLRAYWRSARGVALPEDIVSVDISKTALGKHHTHGQAVELDIQYLDMQIAPSSAMLGAAGLALLLFFVGGYVYKAMPQLTLEHNRLGQEKLLTVQSDYANGLIGLGTILAAIPATIAGALAYRGHTFVRRASRGPRVLLTTLAGEAALLAVVMGLHGPGEFAEQLAYLLSITALVAAGIFLYIRFGWRWRRTERSRRPVKTKAQSPNVCRRRQANYATRFLVLWLTLVFAIAWTQSVMQTRHIFWESFPEDVWNAWLNAIWPIIVLGVVLITVVPRMIAERRNNRRRK
jgi:hypothetical protein